MYVGFLVSALPVLLIAYINRLSKTTAMAANHIWRLTFLGSSVFNPAVTLNLKKDFLRKKRGNQHDVLWRKGTQSLRLKQIFAQRRTSAPDIIRVRQLALCANHSRFVPDTICFENSYRIQFKSTQKTFQEILTITRKSFNCESPFPYRIFLRTHMFIMKMKNSKKRWIQQEVIIYIRDTWKKNLQK